MNIENRNNQSSKIKKPNSLWSDLTHDTDVNFMPGPPRLTREEANDVEILYNNEFVPLIDIELLRESNQLQSTNDNSINELVEDDSELNSLGYKSIDERVSNNIEDRIKRTTVKIDTDEIFIDTFSDKIVDKEFRDKREARQEVDKINIVDKEEEVIRKSEQSLYKTPYNRSNIRSERQISDGFTESFSSVKEVAAVLQIEGLRVEEIADNKMKLIDDGVPSILADTKFTLRLFGQGLTDRTVIFFTYDNFEYGQKCKYLVQGEYTVSSF